MTDFEIYSKVDHTDLRPEADEADIRRLCEEAVLCKTASVCVNPCNVAMCKKLLEGSGVKVCTVIGFPLGACTEKVKVFETLDSIENGADECDMVINIGALKSKNIDAVKSELCAVRAASRGKILKVIIETCLLTQDEKRLMCRLVSNCGADYIKTSTGFSSAGATFADISLFSECVTGGCKIKAAGGIKTRDDMEQFLALGADRLGTSRAVKILGIPKSRASL